MACSVLMSIILLVIFSYSEHCLAAVSFSCLWTKLLLFVIT